MPDPTAQTIVRYTLASDLYDTLTQEVGRISDYYDQNILYYTNLIASCVSLSSYNENELIDDIEEFNTKIESFIPSFEVTPTEDNTFFETLKEYYDDLDFSGISSPALDSIDSSGIEFDENFLFSSSHHMITGAISCSLNEFTKDDFTIAAHISSIAHNTSMSKLEPIFTNISSISTMLLTNFSDIINISDVSSLTATAITLREDLGILSDGTFDYTIPLANIFDSTRSDHIKDIMYSYDMLFNSLFGQIITMGYSLSDKNYKIDLATLSSINPLPGI